jgi:hypothetical protein
MAIKINMEKAFDRMEWNFLFAILAKLGFHPTWINWIRICITSPSFSILINGSPYGLRQGDPLSPFLFILGTEVFSRLLQRQFSIGLLKGIKMARSCSPITHLLFADDLLIFGKATSSEASTIKDCLDSYCKWSGQAVNTTKSSILFSKNTTASSINSIKGILPFKATSATAKYLGLPLFIEKSKKEAFQDILTRVLGKIEGWRAKTLSQAGRIVLIKTTASSIPSYTMSTFLLPKSFCTALDKSFKDFWWRFPKGKSRNLSLKSWRSICIPRHLGGLGIRNMYDVNLALVTKLGWKLLSNLDCLWVNQLREKYIYYGTFLSSPVVSNASWLWQGILHCKSLLTSRACLQVSINSHFPIWTTPWIPTLPNFRPSPKFSGNREQPSLFISDLLILGSSIWNISKILSLFDDLSAQEILKIHISSSSAPNYIWTPANSGKFSISSAYLSILTTNHLELIVISSQLFWKHLWKLKLNDRISFPQPPELIPYYISLIDYQFVHFVKLVMILYITYISTVLLPALCGEIPFGL